MAQLGARLHGMQKVASSSLAGSSTFGRLRTRFWDHLERFSQHFLPILSTTTRVTDLVGCIGGSF